MQTRRTTCSLSACGTRFYSLAIGFAKNYFTYAGGGPATRPGAPPVRPAATVIAEAVFDALNLKR